MNNNFLTRNSAFHVNTDGPNAGGPQLDANRSSMGLMSISGCTACTSLPATTAGGITSSLFSFLRQSTAMPIHVEGRRRQACRPSAIAITRFVCIWLASFDCPNSCATPAVTRLRRRQGRADVWILEETTVRIEVIGEHRKLEGYLSHGFNFVIEKVTTMQGQLPSSRSLDLVWTNFRVHIAEAPLVFMFLPEALRTSTFPWA